MSVRARCSRFHSLRPCPLDDRSRSPPAVRSHLRWTYFARHDSYPDTMTELLQKAFHVEVERQEAREELERQEVRASLSRHKVAMIDFDEQLRSLSQRLNVERPVRRGSRSRSSPGVAAAEDSDSGPGVPPQCSVFRFGRATARIRCSVFRRCSATTRSNRSSTRSNRSRSRDKSSCMGGSECLEHSRRR